MKLGATLIAMLVSVLGTAAVSAAEGDGPGTGDAATTAPPPLVCIPGRLDVWLRWGTTAHEAISIENTGEQALEWRLTLASSWLRVDRRAGSLGSGEKDLLAVTVDAGLIRAPHGWGAQNAALLIETPGAELAPVVIPVSARVHAPVLGVRLGVSTYPEADTELKPRPVVGLSLYPLRAARGRAEINLGFARDVTNLDKLNYYTELAVDWMQLAGTSDSVYWSVGGSAIYEEQGAANFLIASARAGGGVRFGLSPAVESYAGATLGAVSWASVGVNAPLVLTFHWGVGF